jgi:hypothetical protein
MKTSEEHMYKRTVGLPAIFLFITIAFCGIAIGGDDKNEGKDKEQDDKSYPSNFYEQMPPVIQHQCDVLGDRMKATGKERTVYEGDFFNDASKQLKTRVTVQIDGKVKLEGFKDQSAVVSFDGEKASGAVSRIDEALLETFLMDMPEAILDAATKTTAPFRLLGRNFGPDPKKQPDYTGPRYDIYTITMPIVYKQTGGMRVKRFYFDSKTGLLDKTEYLDQSVTPAIKVETHFSIWGSIEGSVYPAKIERYEDGKLVFSFIATKIKGGPAADATDYK